MQRTLLVLLALLGLVLAGPIGCKKKQDTRYIGSWMIDADATIASIDEEQREMAAVFIRMAKFGLVFQEGGVVEITSKMMGVEESVSATYTVVSVEGNEFILQVVRAANEEEGLEEESSKIRLSFLEDDQIRFGPVPEEGETEADVERETLIFKRVSAEEFRAQMDEEAAMPSLEQLFGEGMGGGAIDLEALQEQAAEGEDAVEGEAGADGTAGEEAPAADAAPEAEAAPAEEAPAADAAE